MNKIINIPIILILLVSLIIITTTCYRAYSFDFKTLTEKANYYMDKYKVQCLNEKITNNYGNGYEQLYGTRNMKTILYGIAYRGGANNYYHKDNKRNNHNPLPSDALQNLTNEGFDYAIYLYGTNFSTARKIYTNANDTLKYIQNSGMSRKTQKEILNMVKERIDNSKLGPIYLHCWNGWHQSGYIAAMILMQYCDYTNSKARKYWEENTDGAFKKFEKVKKMIANFKPFDELKINKDTQKIICPCEKTNNNNKEK